MKKLTATQQKIYSEMLATIDEARNSDYPDWLKKHGHSWRYQYDEELLQEAVKRGERREYWENIREGVVLTEANGRSLYRLEQEGLIEILEDGTNRRWGLDTVRVLNY